MKNERISLRVTILFSFILFTSTHLFAQNSKPVSSGEIVRSVFKKGLENCELDFYAGTLMLHGMSEFSLLEGNEDILPEVIGYFKQFGNGQIKATGNFISYEAGGSGAAYLSWKGATSVLDGQVLSAAKRMMDEQRRSVDGLMTAKYVKEGSDKVFIDVAFAVTPYLLYSGLKFNKQEYVDYAVFQTLESFRILKDEKTGLVHQSRGYNGKGNLSEDCWSRGNGWGAFALSLLARDLPDSHPKYKEVIELAKQFFTAVINFQDKQGLWHQEMTAPSSYIETSGSGLLLYGLGIMLEKGLLDSKYMDNFKKGLQAYLPYIGSDGSVSHTCSGCLCPGDGTKQDYINKAWIYNDHHAFGPVVLAFAQAIKMGITEIKPTGKFGKYCIVDSPETIRTYVTAARGRDIAWENDRIAFRVFGPAVRGKVGSGVDVWAKSVGYPILDKWYQLNEEGKNYHTDRGEGCDFYNMGKRSGCGGIAIWIDGKPYHPETFDSYRIRQNQDDKIEFDLQYKTWNVPGMNLSEKRKVQMEKGTNLFKVTSTIQSKENKEIEVAIGLSTFGKAKTEQLKPKGILSTWEEIVPEHGSLGTAVVVDPKMEIDYRTYEGDEFIVIKVRTNEPFTYYAGAGWSKSKQFKSFCEWLKYLKKESKNLSF